jgi:hypothetical protein
MSPLKQTIFMLAGFPLPVIILIALFLHPA